MLLYKDNAIINKPTGITKDRLVTGMVRSRITYVPATTPCQFARVTYIQLLSDQYRDIFNG